MVTPVPTGQLSTIELAATRALCDAAFGDFTDADWEHALGGLHVLVHADGLLVAHGSVVPRLLLVDGRWLRCGYVEAVAVAPDSWRRGHGSTVMAALEALAPDFDLLALSASAAGAALYETRGWCLWTGPSGVATEDGVHPTPDDDGSLYVLADRSLDRSGRIVCDWREGDVW